MQIRPSSAPDASLSWVKSKSTAAMRRDSGSLPPAAAAAKKCAGTAMPTALPKRRRTKKRPKKRKTLFPSTWKTARSS